MNDEHAIGLLETMVRTPSLSGAEGPLAHLLVDTMNRHGLEAFVDGAGNAVGTWGETGPHVLLLGHMDTVPGEIPVRIEDGILYGRGSVDAKGPLAAFVAAASRIVEAQVPMRVTVIGVVEEEAPSSKGARYAAPRYRPDFAIIGEPSSWDAMTLGYKGYIRARINVQCTGTHTAHADATAAELACETWNGIRTRAEAWNEGRDMQFDRLLPTLVEIRTESDGLTDRGILELTVRLPLAMSPDEAEAWLIETCDDATVETTGGIPAWRGPRTTPLHRALGRGIAKQGGRARYLVKTGTADLNIVAPTWGCPACAYGPGDAALDHTPNEHIELAEYVKGVAVLEEAMTHIAMTVDSSDMSCVSNDDQAAT